MLCFMGIENCVVWAGPISGPMMIFLLVNTMVPSVMHERCHVVGVTEVDILAMVFSNAIVLLRYKASEGLIRSL